MNLTCQRNRGRFSETPIAYLTAYRLQVAAHLVCDTDCTLADVAAACGFQSQSYFSKMFRERYGCTPSEYRLRQD